MYLPGIPTNTNINFATCLNNFCTCLVFRWKNVTHSQMIFKMFIFTIHNFTQTKVWSNLNFLTSFHNFAQISQFWPNFTILTKFHNFDRNLQFWQNFTISTKFLKISQFSAALAALYLPFRLIHCCELWALRLKRTWPTYLTYLSDLPIWPTTFL